MEDISLPHDTRVGDILADYFTKKIEGKDAESKEKHSDSQHSSKSKKSKKRKHKKKKKHKSRKAHSVNEANEPDSSADECWVEVTASGAKGNSAKNEAEGPEEEPKKKSASKSKPADTNLSSAADAETRQDMPDKKKDDASKDADKNRSSKSDHQKDTMSKNRTDQVEPSKHSSRRSSQSTSSAKSKSASSSSDSEDDRRNTSKSEPSSSQSAHGGSSKKSPKKKGRSYRTKRCRSSGSSEDEQDRQSKSRSPSPLRGDSSWRSGQHRSRSVSKSRRNSRGRESARDRSKSREKKPDLSRDQSRGRKRSSRSRSQHRGHGSSHRSRSPMRSQAASSRSQKYSESRRSSSPRRSRAARSHSRRRSRSRHSHGRTPPRRSRGRTPPRHSRGRTPPRHSRGRTPPRHSRGRTPPRHSRGRASPRRSHSRRRSESTHRPRSPSRSPKRSRRSTSRDRRHARKSVSPKKQRKSRSRSRKRSTSSQKHSSRRSRSDDKKHSEKHKTVERDKSSEEKSGETSRSGDADSSATDSKKLSVSKPSEEMSGKIDTGDRKSSSGSDKNQVVLYGPFEEEDASFLDEEPSPERTASSTKPTQPESCSAAVDKTSKPRPVTDNLDAVPLPEEPAVTPDDPQLEDMDISNSPSPVGALEVDDSLARPVPSGENTLSPVESPKCDTETASQKRTPPVKVDLHGEEAKKPGVARAAIPWNYNEPQQVPLAPPWVKPETTKPVGQVKPFVREVNPSGLAVQKSPLQAKQDGVAIVGTVATAQAVAEPPSMGPGSTICKAGELGVLENTARAAEHASFPELTAKLVPQAPFTAVPAVNMHGGTLYSAAVMPVHIPFQFMGVPGQAQVIHGTSPPLPQEKPSPVTQEQQTCPVPTQLGPAGKELASEQFVPSTAPSQNEGQVENECVPPSSTKGPPSQVPEDVVVDQVADTAGSAKETGQSNCSSRSSSPAEKERSRSSSKERSNSSRSRSCSGDRETVKRSRSRESESPVKDSKRLRKDDSTEREQMRAKSRSRDRHGSASPDRSRRDTHLKKKSRSPDKKQSKSIDRRRSRSHDRRRSKSRDRKRSKSRDRRGSKSRDRKRSQSREKKRSKSRDRKRSKSRDRKRSKSREKKRSKSRDRRRSKSRERKRSKSHERKSSKSREKRSKSRDRRGSRSRDRRRSKSRDHHRSGSRGRQRTVWRSNSRSRRSRSRDQPKRQSRSRETRRSRRSESRKRNLSQRKSSRERESPRGTIILKRYKNELSSESDSSPERKSKKAPSSPVKKRQRRESDADSTDSPDDKSPEVHTKSSESSEALNEDGIAEQCKEKELEKQPSSEMLEDKEIAEAAPYGPAPPTEASVVSAPEPVPDSGQSVDIEMDDRQDVSGGTGDCTEPNIANKVSETSAVSSSSSEEIVSQVEEGSAAVGSNRPVEIVASSDDRAIKLSEPLEQEEVIATSSSKSIVCGDAGVLQENADLSKNLHDPVACETSIVSSGEGAVSSSTGSPKKQEAAESDKVHYGASPCRKKPIEKASSPAADPVTTCVDSSSDSEAEQHTILAKEQADTSIPPPPPSSFGDTSDALDEKRKSRSRSRSSTSSIERARMRKESSSSSSSSSQEEHTLKERSNSRSASADSRSREGRAESQVKKTQSQDKRRSRSREKKRSRSRDKRRSRSKEKKRSRSREKKRSKSREKRRSRSRDKSLRSKEKKRSKSRERKRTPSRDKKRSRSREKRRSRSREKRTSRSRDKRRSRSRDRKRSPSRDNRDKRRSSREKRRSRSRDKRRSRSRDKKRSPSRDRKRSRSRERRRSRDKKSRSRSRDKRRSRSREKRRSRSRPRRSWSRAMELQRKRSAERLRKKSRSPRRRSLSKRRSPPRKKSRSRSRSRRRSRTHSPERKRKSRSRDREPSVVKVDKAQLLEAARKNMQAMLQRGVVAKGLPVAAAAAVNATVKVVAAAVAAAAADPKSSLAAKLDVTATPPSEAPVLPLAMSGDGTGPAVTLGVTEEPPKVKKSLAALTEICKAISDEEKREYAGEVEPKTAEEVAEEFQQTHHHPFKLKDPPPPIRFNIPNATNLPVKTLAEKVADAAHLHKQFPVSSGSQHRVKELEWVPVEKTEPAAPVKAARAAKGHTHREEGGTSPLALMPPPSPVPAPTHMPPYPDTFTPLPIVAAAPPVFQVEEVPLPVSSAVISSTVMEPPDAPAAELETGDVHESGACLKPKSPPGNDPLSLSDCDNSDNKQAACNSSTQELSASHLNLSNPDDKEDTCNYLNQDDRPGEKLGNTASQPAMQCNASNEHLYPIFSFEDIPLESIPLPDGPYIPPEAQQFEPSSSPPRLQDEGSVITTNVQPQNQALEQRKQDIALEQPSLGKDTASNIGDSISESPAKVAAHDQEEPFEETKSVDCQERAPSSKTDTRGMVRSEQQACAETERSSPLELRAHGNWATSNRAAENSLSGHKHRGQVPVFSTGKQEDRQHEPEQPSDSNSIKAKLKKLRRESIMSVLNNEPLKITPKIVTTAQSSETRQNCASLCMQAWSDTPKSQKETAYFTCDSKTAPTTQSKKAQSNNVSADKAEPHGSQCPPRLNTPRRSHPDGKPHPQPSADVVRQPKTVRHSQTTVENRNRDSFSCQKICGNIVTQLRPGYLSFGNKIVDPAPPVQPPIRDEPKSSSTELDSQSGQKREDNSTGKLQSTPTVHPENLASAEHNSLSENTATPAQVSRSTGTKLKPSSKRSQSADGTRQLELADAKLSVEPASVYGYKAEHCGHSSVEPRTQRSVGKHEGNATELSRYSGIHTASKLCPQGQESVVQAESSNGPRKQTKENTSGQPEAFVTPLPKHMSVLDEINSQPLLMTSCALNAQAEPECTLPLEMKQAHEHEPSVKAAKEKPTAIKQFAHQDSGSPCQQAERAILKKQHEVMFAVKSGELETPLPVENMDITVTAAVDDIQRTPASLSSKNRTGSSQQDTNHQNTIQQNTSIQHECFEKNTNLNHHDTVASPPATGPSQRLAMPDLPQNQNYTRESNAAANIGAAQDSDGIAPVSIQTITPECRRHVPLSRDNRTGASQEAHRFPEKAPEDDLASELELATLTEPSVQLVLNERCTGQVCTHRAGPPELSSQHQEQEIDSKTEQLCASETAKETVELASPQVRITNNDGVPGEADSHNMAPVEEEEKEHEIVKAPSAPPSRQEQEINLGTEELNVSEIAKTAELMLPKVSLRNDGCAFHEAMSDGISTSNEEGELPATIKNPCVPPSLILAKPQVLSIGTSAPSGDSDIDIRISMSPLGDGHTVPKELQQTSAFNEQNNGLAAVSDSSETQFIQREPTLEQYQPNSSEHDVSRQAEPHSFLQPVSNNNSEFRVLKSLLNHEQTEKPVVNTPEHPALCFLAENLDAKQGSGGPPPGISTAGAYREVGVDVRQEAVMDSQSEASLPRENNSKSAPACLNEEATSEQMELDRDSSEPSGDDAGMSGQHALHAQREQPQRQTVIVEYENLHLALPVKIVEVGKPTQPLLSHVQTTAEQKCVTDDHTTQSRYSATNESLKTKTDAPDNSIATGIAYSVTEYSVEDVQAAEASLLSNREESVIEQTNAESNLTAEQLGGGCSYEFMQPELGQAQLLKDDGTERKMSTTPLLQQNEDDESMTLLKEQKQIFLTESRNHCGHQPKRKARSDKPREDANKHENLSVMQAPEGAEAGNAILFLSQAQLTEAKKAEQDSTLSAGGRNQLEFEPVLEGAVKQVQVQNVATYNDGRDSFVKSPPEDDDKGEVVSPSNEMSANTKQTEFNSQLRGEHRDESCYEPAFANSLHSQQLPEVAAGNKQDLSVISSGINVETKTTLSLLAQKQESSEQTHVDGLLTNIADGSTCKHAFADKKEHHQVGLTNVEQEYTSIHAVQAVVLSAYDQSEGHARECATNEDNVQALQTVVNLEDIEVASVVEVSAEETLLPASVSLQDGCYRFEVCLQEPTVNEQEVVGTVESKTKSGNYAASGLFPLPSNPEQLPAATVVESQRAEGGATKHATESEMQSNATAERSEVVPSLPFNSTPLSPLVLPAAERGSTSTAYSDAYCQEVPNQPPHEQHAQPICPPTSKDLPGQHHSPDRELEATALKQTTLSDADAGSINPENPTLPPLRPHEGLPSVHDKTQQSHHEVFVSTSGCGYDEGTKTQTVEHTESLTLLPPWKAREGSFNGGFSLKTLPSSQTGNEATSSQSLGKTVSPQTVLSVPNAVVSHSPHLEVQPQFAEPTEHMQYTDKDAPLDKNVESQGLAQKMSLLGMQPVTHEPRENTSSGSAILSKHSQTPPHSPHSPPPPEKHKSAKATAAPKRRAKKASAHLQAETEAVMPSLRRSTRNKRQPERFCP